MLLTMLLFSCKGQRPAPSAGQSSNAATTVVGGGCDGCELMYAGLPDDLRSTDTSAGWFETGQKLVITGRVLQQDGRTPGAGIILYYWQTDASGHYSPKLGLDQRALRHGHIRGWVKTGADGRYAIYTIRPAPYPGRNIPAHIHISVKEPSIANEYYIDDWVFDDDPLLTTVERRKLENRGGSGILRLVRKDSIDMAAHNVILGLHVPGYPAPVVTSVDSGLSIGEDSPSFTPFHAYGLDAGSRACPVCKYGRNYGVLYFVGNHPDWPEIRQWLRFLEEESAKRAPYLKVCFVYGNEHDYDKSARTVQLKQLGEELQLQHLALTFVPSMADRASEVYLNRINPEVKNTIVVYHHSNIIDKHINLPADRAGFELISEQLNSHQATASPGH